MANSRTVAFVRSGRGLSINLVTGKNLLPLTGAALAERNFDRRSGALAKALFYSSGFDSCPLLACRPLVGTLHDSLR